MNHFCSNCGHKFSRHQFYTKRNGKRYKQCIKCISKKRSVNKQLPRNFEEMVVNHPYCLAVDLLVAGLKPDQVGYVVNLMYRLK